jgi:hypothetical protein
MRKLIGVFIALAGIALVLILILRIWNVQIIGWQDLLRSGLTVGLLAGALVFLLVVRYFFFRDKPADRR